MSPTGRVAHPIGHSLGDTERLRMDQQAHHKFSGLAKRPVRASDHHALESSPVWYIDLAIETRERLSESLEEFLDELGGRLEPLPLAIGVKASILVPNSNVHDRKTEGH